MTRPDAANGERDHHFPSLLPGGRGVLFTIVRESGYQNQTSVAVLDLETGRWRTLIQSGRQAEYVETGHLIYADGGALWAVGFNVRDLEVVGDPVPVLERIGRPNSVSNLAVSWRGTLAYAAAFEGEGLSLVWVDRRGNESPIAAPRRHYFQPRLSPDGTRIAVALNDDRGLAFWLWDFSLQRLTPLPVKDKSTGSFSVWSPDSRHLIFNGWAGGQSQLFRRAADGTGAETQLTSGDS
ncbi:MAG TPA: hypothetical protein VMO26_13630 [Vicinamibacterales bacterium]|nr:hypothetical protein [Vicinamibacterales bacterium]